MDKFFINGGRKLFGSVEVESAKNALLPIIAGCVLNEGVVTLERVPKFFDVLAMCDILKSMGITATFFDDRLVIDARTPTRQEFSHQEAGRVRASIFLLGPLLARHKVAKVSYPGGCDIGLRPIDLHLKGLRKLGAKIVEKNGYIYADGRNMAGEQVAFEFPSVGATENLMMAAVLTKGTTRLYNCAKEPEIVDLQDFLNACGAKVYGAGSGEIVVEGVERLKKDVGWSTIPDRIIAGTYLIATAMCGGDVTIVANPAHNQALINKLSNYACQIDIKSDKIRIRAEGRPKSFGYISTEVYPGFPTDLQPQALALESISQGECVVVENLFESRFKHVSELLRMGADIKVKGKVCLVTGRERLYGAEVMACDLRGGACLTLAGLVAEGYTQVYGVEHIDRGYYKLEKTLSMLGADIRREEY